MFPEDCRPKTLIGTYRLVNKTMFGKLDVFGAAVQQMLIPPSGDEFGDDDSANSNMEINPDQLEKLHRELSIPTTGFVTSAADSGACAAFREQLQKEPVVTSEDENGNSGDCAPHAVLAGYAKCATSTLQ